MNIKMLVLDVDGTLTDGKIYIGSQGELMKAFNVKDGLGIVKLQTHEIVPVIITGRVSGIVEQRAKELGITEVHQGIKDKVKVLKQIADRYQYDLKELAYIGDDENDIEAMKLCGWVGCPADAADSVIAIADYVCKRNGGEGAVREFIDYLL
ncbi:KdsC family phosphatase [Niallia endozanthoxylica]|uniref:HAD-IIIA family hydrolase n=1 Tax=Niallia endozanthoxylica TaxID=2036016 RepID=A0A5J5I354_9BACI|nr:HAD-IIIA family hydrolase [Niallia endozanthoxylica]KAA9030657.1 HAD-IIIA family hydrolase [Niallia endozanthoxylica]